MARRGQGTLLQTGGGPPPSQQLGQSSEDQHRRQLGQAGRSGHKKVLGGLTFTRPDGPRPRAGSKGFWKIPPCREDDPHPQAVFPESGSRVHLLNRCVCRLSDHKASREKQGRRHGWWEGVGVHPSLQPRPWELCVERNGIAAGPVPSLGEQRGGGRRAATRSGPVSLLPARRLSPSSREAPPPRALQGSGEPDAGSCPTGTHSPACCRHTAFVTFLTCCRWFSVRPSLAWGVGWQGTPAAPCTVVSAGASRLQVTHQLTGSERRRAQQPQAGRPGGQPGPWAQAPPGQDSVYTGLNPGALPGGASRNVPTECQRPRRSDGDRGGAAGATRSRHGV